MEKRLGVEPESPESPRISMVLACLWDILHGKGRLSRRPRNRLHALSGPDCACVHMLMVTLHECESCECQAFRLLVATPLTISLLAEGLWLVGKPRPSVPHL